MAEIRKINFICKSLIGNAKDTIDAIQKYIDKYDASRLNNLNKEESPAESVNRILNSVSCEETNAEIQKIINFL